GDKTRRPTKQLPTAEISPALKPDRPPVTRAAVPAHSIDGTKLWRRTLPDPNEERQSAIVCSHFSGRGEADPNALRRPILKPGQSRTDAMIMTLPSGRARDGARRPGSDASDVLIDPRILLIDDNQAIHEDIRKILD